MFSRVLEKENYDLIEYCKVTEDADKKKLMKHHYLPKIKKREIYSLSIALYKALQDIVYIQLPPRCPF